jgi:hypothetical protein
VVDDATPNNNNITHRNVSLQDSDEDQVADSLFVRNPHRKSIRTMVLAEVPEKWKVDVSGVPLGQPFSLKAGSEKLLKYVIHPPERGARGDVSFVQYDLTSKEPRVMGGFSIAVAARNKEVTIRSWRRGLRNFCRASQRVWTASMVCFRG